MAASRRSDERPVARTATRTVGRHDAAANAAAFRDLRDRNLHSQISVCANEKGGVVRRPFSKLQAWLIAVSPQPGVAVAIGTDGKDLECKRYAQENRLANGL